MVLSRLNQVVTLIFLRNHVCSLFKYWCFCSPTVPCQWHWALSLFGHVNKNKRHFVLITRLSDIHGTDRCETLLGLHYSDFCGYSSTVLCENGHHCWKKNLKKFPWFNTFACPERRSWKKIFMKTWALSIVCMADSDKFVKISNWLRWIRGSIHATESKGLSLLWQ